MLRFSEANAKTSKLAELAQLSAVLANRRKVYSLDLLSGWTCPAAKDCMAKVYIENGKRSLRDGPHTQFRCFSASQEVAYPNVYKMRDGNFQTIKQLRGHVQIAKLICDLLPKNAGVVRYHVAGDFFKLAYLKGAILAAEWRPDVHFYGYTKMINLLSQVELDDPQNGVIRQNFLITASLGGKYDHLIKDLGLRTAKVVFDEAQAGKLPIDHDDSHAATTGGSFALLLHGVQPKGSEASKALVALRGKGTYKRKG